MPIEKIVILIVATFGITDLITKQNGLFHIFKRWRDYLAKNKPQINEETATHDDWDRYDLACDDWEKSVMGQLSELFGCHFCLGFWIAGLLTVVYTGTGWYTLVYWLAVYGGHAMISRMVYK